MSEETGTPIPASTPATEPQQLATGAPGAPAGTQPAPGEVDVQGVKMVPLAAVQAERTARQALEKEVEEHRRTQAYLQQARPALEYVAAHPELLEEGGRPAAKPEPDPEVTEWARAMSLYKPNGELDLESARRSLAIAEQRVARQTQAAIAPLANVSAHDRASANFERARRVQDPTGKRPSAESLQAVFQAAGRDAADPQVAAGLVALAFGLDRMTGRTAPDLPPVETEGIGGRTPNQKPMSDLESGIAKQRGVKPDDWQKLTRGFHSGRSTILEDE